MHVIKIISLIIFGLLTKTFASNLHACYYLKKHQNVRMLPKVHHSVLSVQCEQRA